MHLSQAQNTWQLDNALLMGSNTMPHGYGAHYALLSADFWVIAFVPGGAIKTILKFVFVM